MLDQWTIQWIRPPIEKTAILLNSKGIRPDQVTLAGFLIGLTAIPLLAWQCYVTSLVMILLNRIMDGIDGALARLQQPTDAGGFLDITLDFIFYSSVVLGFAVADPSRNAIAANFLLFSFVGTSASFLAYGIMAEKNCLTHPQFAYKSLYYLGGLAEGTETILFFTVSCLMPAYFPVLAFSFSFICMITTISRIWTGYKTIKSSANKVFIR
ncbi:MAG: CDP-alcohol phosphatidyltransferase family protein [Candidatus Endonucleobacter sp. (ex Gigantidas childressi)]|nr:CDP-alcohol phosphatidyltransferase family protein [Candidatus Endonucleobacter sp. (ex Gigantidas childressi)]